MARSDGPEGGAGGQGRVTVGAKVPWLDPLAAYEALRAAGARPTLLLGAGPHPEAGWSFVAFDPVRELRVHGSEVEEVHPLGSTTTVGNVLGHLREALEPVGGGPEAAPFTGGWVGFFGYEFARHLDPLFPAPRRRSLPDAVLRLCAGALAFDNQAQAMTAWASDLEGDGKAAQARLDAVVRLLQDGPARRAATAAVAMALDGEGTPAASGPASAPAGASPVVASGADLARPPGQEVWEESLTADQFMVSAAGLRDLVRHGDLFQANLATRFSAPCTATPVQLLARLRDANPSPFMGIFEEPGFTIVSGSPEQLLGIRDGRIRSRPIAGTRRRGAAEPEDAMSERELREDRKEQAEHTMLVDLVRNDIARVAVPGSVEVPERGAVERYRHVMHLASRVEGTLRPEATFLDAFAALFPGGTVTGAPKMRACRRIQESETVPRGPYTGSLGFLSWTGNAQWNILIRTLVLEDDFLGTVTAHVHAGAGIVAGSDPEREWKEAGRKARALLQAAEGRVSGGSLTRLGEATPSPAWRPAAAPRRVEGRRVLLIDNEDSFVHNLADYCALLGAHTTVVRNTVDLGEALAQHRPTHVVLSPGPGWPKDSGATLQAARELHGRLPILGVCLGHQAIAQAHGANVVLHPHGPVHGEPAQIQHDGAGLFAGLANPLVATRYHSLVVEASTLGPDWSVDARLADGTVMALRHRIHPTYGFQFHPESLCTDAGLELIARFLEASA